MNDEIGTYEPSLERKSDGKYKFKGFEMLNKSLKKTLLMSRKRRRLK